MMVRQEWTERTALLSPALFRRHCTSHTKKENLISCTTRKKKLKRKWMSHRSLSQTEEGSSLCQIKHCKQQSNQFSFCGTNTKIWTRKMENCLSMTEAEQYWLLSLYLFYIFSLFLGWWFLFCCCFVGIGGFYPPVCWGIKVYKDMY